MTGPAQQGIEFVRKLLAAAALVCTIAAPVCAETVLITGANRGLGLEFAKQYAADGWTVIGTARRRRYNSQEMPASANAVSRTSNHAGQSPAKMNSLRA